ncbi:GGDEF domain-containing protein [Angustibacter luteus]|uniref:GGDEF domain-containing protein n=1 Tax=Angustibacter luteus TaxID=658456 RepID=A0ABW1JGF9_9ACTN
MTLSETAARVMTLAQDGQIEAARTLADDGLAGCADASLSDQSAFWYTVAVLEHVDQQPTAMVAAADRSIELAVAAGSDGWAANSRSLRAMAWIRQGQVERALLDLARSEVELAACDDAGLRCWAHTGLGYCYLEIRLYELAQPHFEAAARLDASPIPLPSARTIDLMNLAELHLRWADELERVVERDQTGSDPGFGDDETVDRHRAIGHAHAIDAVASARGVGAPSLLAGALAMELCSRPLRDAPTWLPQMRETFADPDHRDHQGTRAQIGGRLARALWSVGEHEHALTTARASADYARAAGDWQVAGSAQWLLVELEALAGVPGAAAGREYGRLLSRVLWQQRLSTLQGAKAALDVERLRRDTQIAQREAAEDPLTGIGNRRALTEALRAAAERFGEVAPDVGHRPWHSLLVIDLDGFKAINDLHGHVLGDEVLRAVAAALRGAARAEDVVVRLGGDEFVVLAQDADEAAGLALADRIAESISALSVPSPAGPITLRASVGVRTTSATIGLAELLDEADRAMYRVKASHAGGTVPTTRADDGLRGA